MSDLHWISRDQLIEITKGCFSKALESINAKDRNLRSDPTLLLALSTFLNLSTQEVDRIQNDVKTVKSLQNAIGTFHQTVLGSVAGWTDTGKSGGVIDLLSEGEVALAKNRHVVAEVKMRYNTIKASDECKMWDKLKEAAASRGGAEKCVAYIIQMIPKTNEPYDRPWRVSGRPEVNYVRAIDGRSAYHLVTGDPNALDDLLHLLPSVFREVLTSTTDIYSSDLATSLPLTYIDAAIKNSLPNTSALEA